MRKALVLLSLPLSSCSLLISLLKPPFDCGDGEPVSGDFCFERPTSFFTEGDAFVIAGGDVDGDGDPDVITANRRNDSMTFLQNEEGEFTPTNIATQVSGPFGITTGDLNGDQLSDVILTSQFGFNVAFFFNTGGGEFSFDAADSRSIDSGPSLGVIDDLDNAPGKDVAIINEQAGTLDFFPNQGGGTFGNAVSQGTGGQAPAAIASGNLDGVGPAELAIANTNDDNVTIFVSDGVGLVLDQTLSLNAGPRGLTMADLNQDGLLDIATCNGGSNGSISVLLQNPGGSFDAPVDLPAGDTPEDIVAGDFDGDGDQDLFVANIVSDDLMLYENNGQGAFTLAETILLEGDPTAAPRSLVAADFNGDGVSDLACSALALDSVVVFLSRP